MQYKNAYKLEILVSLVKLSSIANSYAQTETKKVYDVKNTSFTFKFDEITNRQIQIEYDGYRLKQKNEVANTYCGSLFIGYCTADDMLEHYDDFIHKHDFNLSFLLYLGIFLKNDTNCRTIHSFCYIN